MDALQSGKKKGLSSGRAAVRIDQFRRADLVARRTKLFFRQLGQHLLEVEADLRPLSSKVFVEKTVELVQDALAMLLHVDGVVCQPFLHFGGVGRVDACEVGRLVSRQETIGEAKKSVALRSTKRRLHRLSRSAGHRRAPTYGDPCGALDVLVDLLGDGLQGSKGLHGAAAPTNLKQTCKSAGSNGGQPTRPIFLFLKSTL
jgi:hypothetical protein